MNQSRSLGTLDPRQRTEYASAPEKRIVLLAVAVFLVSVFGFQALKKDAAIPDAVSRPARGG
jgi:hypothetical protein